MRRHNYFILPFLRPVYFLNFIEAVDLNLCYFKAGLSKSGTNDQFLKLLVDRPIIFKEDELFS